MSDTMRAFRRNRAIGKSRYAQLYRPPSQLSRVSYGKSNTMRLHYSNTLTGQPDLRLSQVFSVVSAITLSNDWANVKGTYAQFNCIRVKVVVDWVSDSNVNTGVCYDPVVVDPLTNYNQIGDFNNHTYKSFGQETNRMVLTFRPRGKTPPPYPTDSPSTDSIGYIKFYSAAITPVSNGSSYASINMYFWLVVGSEQ